MDRYTNWPLVERASDGASGLIRSLRNYFSTFGIAEELASDGGPEFTSSLTQEFLKTWGVHHRLSSVAFPHSNCRAEIGVKTVKRMIADNSGPHGELDTDKFQRAILQYRNCPDKDTKLSPAECLFGRPIRDFIPILPGRYRPHSTWRETLQAREGALRNRHMRVAERWSEHTRRLPPLVVGDRVRVQNQVGPHPTKWDKTGTVIEVRQYDQYVVKMDGSGRMTNRNRKFLRKYIPVMPPTPTISISKDLAYQKSPNVPTASLPLQQHGVPNLPPPSRTMPEQLQDTTGVEPNLPMLEHAPPEPTATPPSSEPVVATPPVSNVRPQCRHYTIHN